VGAPEVVLPVVVVVVVVPVVVVEVSVLVLELVVVVVVVSTAGATRTWSVAAGRPTAGEDVAVWAEGTAPVPEELPDGTTCGALWMPAVDEPPLPAAAGEAPGEPAAEPTETPEDDGSVTLAGPAPADEAAIVDGDAETLAGTACAAAPLTPGAPVAATREAPPAPPAMEKPIAVRSAAIATTPPP
jgi:hypothetical protein